MKKRIFLAIRISRTITSKIITWQQNHQTLPVRFIKPKNLHLTIVPPWYGNPKDVINTLKKLPLSVSPFSIHFQKIIPGPEPVRPRLIWIEGKPINRLTTLKKELAKFLEAKSEKRSFIPHITIARVKHGNEKQLAETVIEEEVNWQILVNSFFLMESHLSLRGADYKILAKFPLPKCLVKEK
jgi:2'-5' RNA ligase